MVQFSVDKYIVFLFVIQLFIKRGDNMSISYKKLWKLLIDRDMKKKDLIEISGISTASMAKLGRGDNITTEVLLKICKALDCELEDIMEIDRG